MAAMLVELKRGHCGAGMVAAVERVGKVLAEHLPRETNDVNELPDRLIEL
jgi:putative membrane protein